MLQEENMKGDLQKAVGKSMLLLSALKIDWKTYLFCNPIGHLF